MKCVSIFDSAVSTMSLSTVLYEQSNRTLNINWLYRSDCTTVVLGHRSSTVVTD